MGLVRGKSIGCSNKKCRGFLLNTHTIEHVETQTRYYLIKVNLFDTLVFGFLFFQYKFPSKLRLKTFPNQTFTKNQ